MVDPERQEASGAETPDKAAEFVWLKENRNAFFLYVRDQFAEQGRGALVIDTTAEPLGEETPFYYASQDKIAEQDDEVSRRLATFVGEYEPEVEFVAVFIRSGIELEFSMYQIRVGEGLAQAVNRVSRGQSLTRINAELSHLNQLLGDVDQIFDQDIEEAKRRVNGNHDSRT